MTGGLVGDDTGYLHIPPLAHVQWKQMGEHRFVNMTVMPMVYEGGKLEMTMNTLEFRPAFHEYQYNGNACPVEYLTGAANSNTRTFKFWGHILVPEVHLLVATGVTLSFELPHKRELTCEGITVQSYGYINFNSFEGLENDNWNVTVTSNKETSMKSGHVNIASHGQITARSLTLNTDVVHIAADGHLSADEMGHVRGHGAGYNYGRTSIGGCYGGKGGRSKSMLQTSDLNNTVWDGVYGSIEQPDLFGSGGVGNSFISSSRGGVGGGYLDLTVTVLKVEGLISANGGSSNSGSGGSGGSIMVHATTVEGHGMLSTNGGTGSCTSPSDLICGGGGGGRIALNHRNDLRWWKGDVTSYGGVGTFNSNPGGYGGAGTVLYSRKHSSGKKTIWMELKNNRGSNTNFDLEDGLTLLINISQVNNTNTRSKRDATLLPLGVNRVNVVGGARVTLQRSYETLDSRYFVSGDGTGWLHVQGGQTVVMHALSQAEPYRKINEDVFGEYGEIMTNIFVHEGGYLVLPPDTTCRDARIIVLGTIAVNNVTVASGCHLQFGTTGRSRLLDTNQGSVDSPQPSVKEGVFNFVSLNVGDGGEVSAFIQTDDVRNNVSIVAVQTVHVFGGGKIHAVSVHIHARRLVIDDLGVITGDLNTISCHGDPHTSTTNSNGQPLILTGSGKTGAGGSGAGHGGRGGRGSGQHHTGGSYGSLFEPISHGCSGGGDGVRAGGRGGGNVVFNVTNELQIDGLVEADGESVEVGAAGGGSGGSIVFHVNNMRGYGDVTVNGGHGHACDANHNDVNNCIGVRTSGIKSGGGGAAGRIAVYFASNKTYSGSWQAHGGKPGNVVGNYVSSDTTTGYGGPGTMYFYHTVHKHTTLIVNNNGHGPDKDNNYIADYSDLKNDESRAWFLPTHRNSDESSSHDFYFDEIQVWGKAHFAVSPLNHTIAGSLADVGFDANIYFENLIGDRTGAIHIGSLQSMDLERPFIDLPFSAHVYRHGHLGLAPIVHVHGVTIWLDGALTHVRNITVKHHGRLWLNRHGRTAGSFDIDDTSYSDELDGPQFAGKYTFDYVHVKDNGYIHMISNPVVDPGTQFNVQDMVVDGGGLVEATHVYVHAVNITIDAGGKISANNQGYTTQHGAPIHQNGSYNIGYHGIINPGMGYYASSHAPSGAGHGGSGGHGSGNGVLKTGQPYGNLYEPEVFGSAGGGPNAGSGGGRIWLNVTGMIHIDGELCADGGNADTTSGSIGAGGSGGSLWLHSNVLSGYGIVSANGGKGGLNGFGGGGAGGRVAVYFNKNITFSSFTFHAHGGRCHKSTITPPCEVGGPGTIFLYHNIEDHRTLRVENGGASIGTRRLFAKPRNKLINWDKLDEDGGRAWILSANSGGHKFANFGHDFHFEELQVYGGAHLAVMDPSKIPADQIWRYQITRYYARNIGGQDILSSPANESDLPSTTELPLTGVLPGNVTLHFKYFIGDRSGAVHVGDGQTMDLERYEIDLPFSAYIYHGAFLGLAPITMVHGVEIWISGVMAHVSNMTLKQNGTATFNFMGRTVETRKLHDGGTSLKDFDPQSTIDTAVYVFNSIRVQDTGLVEMVSDPVTQPRGVDIFAHTLVVEGGGEVRGPRVILDVHNATIDSGGRLHSNGLGYANHHEYTQGSIVNIGTPPVPSDVNIGGAGGGHGGSGGRVIRHITSTSSSITDISTAPNYHRRITVDIMRSGLSHGNLYQPTSYGSAGASYSASCYGGNGGGVIRMLVSNTLEVDGTISSDGVAPKPACSSSGGGAGGSIWIHTHRLKGFGLVSSHGGKGSNSQSSSIGGGGGGAGGRTAIYFVKNETLIGFVAYSSGGKAGNTPSSKINGENGGAGTALLYHMIHKHRTLYIDNGGLMPYDSNHLIGDPNPAANNPEDRVTNGRANYEDLKFTGFVHNDGCRTWIIPPPDYVDNEDGEDSIGEVARRGTVEAPVFDYKFEEIQIYGGAHVAISTVPLHNNTSNTTTELVADDANSPAEVDIHFQYMIGDRTGTVHLRPNQTMDLNRDEIDLPFSVRAYTCSYLGLAPITFIHGVTIWMHGVLANIKQLTLHHYGVLAMESGGHTKDHEKNNFQFEKLRIQDDASVYAITSPEFRNPVIKLNTISIKIEGGGKLHATYGHITSYNLTVEDGGFIKADGTGYTIYDHRNTETGVNLGKGHSAADGSSGAGHGGTSGVGTHQQVTGQPYGDLYEPLVMGSAGGTSSHMDGGKRIYTPGGRGGGVLYLNISGTLYIDGEVTAHGAAAQSGRDSGGGSGGSILIHTERITGYGKVAIKGGDGSGGGGAGAGGRIAVYLRDNSTFIGRFVSSGGRGTGGESGGPGTAFVFHAIHHHRTLIVDNDHLTSSRVGKITSYQDTSTDSFKAWIMPDNLGHKLALQHPNFDPTPENNNDSPANSRLEISFEEFQIFGNAHLAVMLSNNANLSHVNATKKDELYINFKDMIGDRSGVVHVGPQQDLDLRRPFVDTPFSSYVYVDGHLGLATSIRMEAVFIHLEGNLSHVENLLMTKGAELRLFLTGAADLVGNYTENAKFRFPNDIRIKDTAKIIGNGPPAHATQYKLISNTLTVDGGAVITAKHILVEATNITVDDGGYITTNNGGYVVNRGPAPGKPHFLGHSGASHGGMGGRGGCEGYKACRLPRNEPYGSLEQPKTFGSGGYGGRGGVGGGIVELRASDVLRVDGVVSANSGDVVSNSDGSSGGSGGSVLTYSAVLTGSWTGNIQALGGAGDFNSGGGGAGGRVAVYYSNQLSDMPYLGQFKAHGGPVGSRAEAGAAGTVYVKHEERNEATLIVNNDNQPSLDTWMHNIGRRLNFAGSSGKSASYNVGSSGRRVESSVASYNRVYHSDCRYNRPLANHGTYYLLSHLFDQTFSSSNNRIFVADARATTITLTLGGRRNINRVRVAPACNFPSKFRITLGITGSRAGIPDSRYYNHVGSQGFIEPATYCRPGSYVDIVVGHLPADYIKIEIEGKKRFCNNQYFAGLSEIEVYVDGQTENSRFLNRELQGAATWIELPTNTGGNFTFHETVVDGHGNLAVMSSTNSMSNDTSDSRVHLGHIRGDLTGVVNIGFKQTWGVTSSSIDVPTSFNLYEGSSLQMPNTTFFHQVGLRSHGGQVSGIDNLHVFNGGTFQLQSTAKYDAGLNAGAHSSNNKTSQTVALSTVIVQSGGTLKLQTHRLV
uniref:uncharacterized protein LOC104266654 n=1 Tax=Ciona intestinalis TaxID=7719 RepID=UPI000EF546CA|nr:uncharacterized protein LOC104266654 [Ciona intestinalis]|eukprot:XP_026694748.1 uncharacterized protein LOC104266654 [Ciona intestinalis]